MSGLKDKDAAREWDRQYRIVNRDAILVRRRAAYVANKEKHRAYYHEHGPAATRRCYAKRKSDPVRMEQRRKTRREWYARRRASDIQFRLAKGLRARVGMAIKGMAIRGGGVRALGCTVDECRAHIEARFLPGMTWQNWGLHGWHIDHVVPISRFNLTDPAQMAAACHYTNLQPLWAADNRKKRDRLPE